MKALSRIFVWVLVSIFLSFLIAPSFLSLLNVALNQNFGNVFPAIPFVALLFVLFALRGKDLLEILNEEKGFKSQITTRLLGSTIILSLLILRGVTSYSVESSGVAIILAVYASSLLINPLTKRLMFPYALIYIAGVSAPAVIQWSLGEPLASFSAALSARVVSLSGIPVTWQGTSFALTSKTGDYIAATVTPGCSSVISITTFLGLLGLMHLDLKKKLQSTIKIAVLGIAVLTLLNSLRILLLIWIGYTSGVAEFWSYHNWVGYALFVGFYLVVMPIYARTAVNQSKTFGFSKWSKILPF